MDHLGVIPIKATPEALRRHADILSKSDDPDTATALKWAADAIERLSDDLRFWNANARRLEIAIKEVEIALARDENIEGAMKIIGKLWTVVYTNCLMDYGVELKTKNAELRTALRQALRQWQMYAEMVESPNDCDLRTEQTPEGEMYRAVLALTLEKS